MDRFEAEERNTTLTMQEKEMLLSIGVLLEDGSVNSEESDEQSNKVTGGRTGDLYLDLEYWNAQFKIIANGGRSEQEERSWRFDFA